MTDWMPVNPCESCNRQTMEQMDNTFDHLGDCRCNAQSRYFHEVYAQRKLLGYLIGDAAGRIPSGIGIQEFKRMLKTLEASQ